MTMENAPESVSLDALLAQSTWVHALARRLVQDDDGADEVVQETWVAAFGRPPRRTGNLRAWLARVVRNAIRERGRGDRRRRQREQHVARPEALPSTRDIVERAAVHRRVVEAVWSLDEPYRTAVLLRYFEDLPPRAVAERLDVSVHTVRTRLRRGLEQLRGILDREHGGSRAAWTLALLPAAVTETAAAAGPAGVVAAAKGALLMSLEWKAVAALLIVAGAVAIVFSLDGDPPASGINASTASSGSLPASPPAAREEMTARRKAQESPHADLAAGTKASEAPVVPRKYAVAGTVKDELGRPLAGAAVCAYRGNAITRSRLDVLSTTFTNEKGEYYLGPVHEKLVLEATYPGRFRSRVVTYPWNEKHFVLGRPGVLTGTVVYSRSGRPCADALVVAYSETHQVTHWKGNPEIGTAEAVVDARGHYRFDDLPPGKLKVYVFPEDNPLYRRKQTIEVPAGTTTTLDLIVPEKQGARLRGRVTAKATGEPVSGATVYAWWNDRQAAVTDADGRYELRGLRELFIEVRIEADGFVSRGQSVEAQSGVDLVQDFALERPGRVRGRVVDADGNPVSEARIAFDSFGTQRFGWKYACLSDERGGFVIGNACPGPERRIFAAADGFAGAVSERFDLAAGEEVGGVEVRLTRGGTVAGTVLDDAGNPVKDVQVWLRLVTGEKSDLRRTGFVPAQKCADGAFRFEHVPAGEYHVQLLARAFRIHRAGRIEIVDDASVTRDFVMPRGQTIAGRVVDSTGKPLSKVVVRAEPQDPTAPYGSAFSEDDGRFEIKGLGRGKYDLSTLDHRSFYRKVKNVVAGRSDVRIRTSRLPKLNGQVVHASSGTPVPRFWCRTSVFRTRHPIEDPDGRFEIPPLTLRAGGDTVRLDFGTEGGLISARPIRLEIREGVDLPTLRVELVEGGALRGRVLGPNGEPAARARVVLLEGLGPDRGDPLIRKRCDANGRFYLRPIRPGTHRVAAHHRDWTSTEATVTVRAGAEERTELRLGQGGGIRVRVLSPDNEPVERAGLSLQPTVDAYRNPYLRANKQGEYHFTGLLPREYAIRASHATWVDATARVAVTTGTDTPVTIRLHRGGGIRVQVTDPLGRAVTDAEVRLEDDRGKRVAIDRNRIRSRFRKMKENAPHLEWKTYHRNLTRTDAGGTLTRLDLAPGAYRIVVNARGFAAEAQPVTVLDGRTVMAYVQLAPASDTPPK